MDGCSWLPFQDARIGSDTASEHFGQLHEPLEQDVVVSSQVQQQLKQIHMLMDMNEHGHAELAPSSSSSTFRSFSSRDENSSRMLTPASTNTITTSCHHLAEVSSLQIPLSPIAYSNLDTIPNLEQFMCQEADHQEHVRSKNGHGGAFRPYVRHLGPMKKPKPGACGQRAIKAAMSALGRMHMARLGQWQCYQMVTAAAAAAAPTGSNCNQLQHVLSERKRREKLNDSFKALRTVLPPAPKKDKASILIRARDYVNSLKSRVSDLEEKNRMLLESQIHNGSNGDQDDDSSDKIDVDISREPAEHSQEFHLKIVLRSGCNSVMDVVVGTLQRLKQIGDVRLVAMDTGSGSGLPPGKDIQQSTITLQLKSRRCNDDFLKESVTKTIKAAMQSMMGTT